MNMNKQNIEEWAEYGVDSRYNTQEERIRPMNYIFDLSITWL